MAPSVPCKPSAGLGYRCYEQHGRIYVAVYFSGVDDFIKDFQKGSPRIPYVEEVIFFGEEKQDGEYHLYHDPFVIGGRLEEKVNEDLLAPENQEKILSALCSVWNLISEWDIEKPIRFEISGRYFRSKDERLTDLAHQKNIWMLACEDAAFASPFDVLKMAKLAPNLKKLRLQVRDMSKRMRNKLANDMRTWETTLPKLSGLMLVGDRDPYSRGDGRKLEDMRNDGVDLLCRELRLLAQQHGFIGLGLEFVPISAELFEDTQKPEAEMKWPTLKKLDILVHEMLSTGEWLFSAASKDSKDSKDSKSEGSKLPTGQLCEVSVTGDLQIIEFVERTEAIEEKIRPLAELFERTCTRKNMPEITEVDLNYDEGVDGPVKSFRF